MGEQKITVRKPLFDRLVDQDRTLTRELRPLRTLGRAELKDSVRRELEHLLNTRVSLPVHRLRSRERTVVDYGIPDFSSFSARNHDDRLRLAEMIRMAIAAYEPRLTDVRVRLESVAGNDGVISGVIEASLITGRVTEPVSFATNLQIGDGAVEVFDAS
jgi:type VI secretion system protein ImpF